MNDTSIGDFSTWSIGRKITASVFAVSGYAAFACLAVYFSGALFLILNKINPSRAEFLSIARYWQLFADDPLLRKKLQISMAVPSIGLLIALPAWLIVAARPRRSLHGDARFATPAEVAQSGLLSDIEPGILIGSYRGRNLTLGGQQSVMLSAPTRAGKGVSVVIPNLLTWQHSVVVLDIKRENYVVTAGLRAALRQRVYRFSPYDSQQRSHRWNPLSAVRSNAGDRTGDLLAISQVFYPEDGRGTSSDAFFNNQARNLFLGLGLMLLETPELPRTMGEMLRQSSGKGRPVREHIEDLIAKRKLRRLPLSNECTEALQRLLSNSDNTLSSIVASFAAPLLVFADAKVDAATCADDFRLEDVRRCRMSIYVQIPSNRLDIARPMVNLFFSQLVNLNTEQLPAEDPGLKYQCLLVNDEFTSMGRASALVGAAAFLAGYNLRLLTVVQAMSQLDSLYGEKEARSFATNHALQILFAPREQRDADEYSAMLGQFTQRATSHGRSHSFSVHGHSSVSSNDSDQRRALMLPQEFKGLGKRKLVVIMENCRPILADKIYFHESRDFKRRLLQPPEVPLLNFKACLSGAPQGELPFDDLQTDARPAAEEQEPSNPVSDVGVALAGALSKVLGNAPTDVPAAFSDADTSSIAATAPAPSKAPVSARDIEQHRKERPCER